MSKLKRIPIRVTDEMHRKLKVICAEEETSMQALILAFLLEYIALSEQGEPSCRDENKAHGNV